MPAVPSYHNVSVTDRRTGSALKLFYRQAGSQDDPVVLLLHVFPTSSHQYRGLIDRLADKYRVIAPDLPGFGFSDAPDVKAFGYTFDHLAEVIESFTDAIGLTRYALYVFDYGAPVGFRLAVSRPERVSALISQNGNAYEKGLSDGWESHPRLLAGSHRGEPCQLAYLPAVRNDPIPIRTRRAKHIADCPGQLHARPILPRPAWQR